jgi:hypothetical protein
MKQLRRRGLPCRETTLRGSGEKALLRAGFRDYLADVRLLSRSKLQALFLQTTVVS